MITIFDLVRPFPKNIKIEKSKNIDCYFDYKKYVRIDILCKNLLKLNDNNLFEALSIFGKNHYNFRDTLYYNLQELTISEIYDKNIDGTYVLSSDTNDLSYKTFEDIYHELLHVASSQLDKTKNVLYSGFGFYEGKSNVSIGEGITDGYIELICDRDLHEGRFIHNIKPNYEGYSVNYFYAKSLARQLEIVVGKDLLKDMFFSYGYLRLNEFLLQYKDQESINQFFKNCDIAAIAENYRNPLLNKKVIQAQEFLLDIIKQYMPHKQEIIKKEKLISVGTFGRYLTTGVVQEELEKIRQMKVNLDKRR